MVYDVRSRISAPAELIRAKRFGVALHSQVLGRAESLPGQSSAAILADEGSILLRVADRERRVEAASVCWLPWNEACRVTAHPGASGVFVNLTATALNNAIGYQAESNGLRILSSQQILLSLSGKPELSAVMRNSFHAIAAEHFRQDAAARAVVDAYLRIILVNLWRALTEAGPVREPGSPRIDLFNRFNGLVETHFRERWPASAYAAALRISRDRLGDICRSASGRSPKRIIDLRVAIEARLLLEHSTYSIEQISGLLGFVTPSHFTRFFQRIAGAAPSRYRSEQLWAEAAGDEPMRSALHEWP